MLRPKELPQATYQRADRTESGGGRERPEPRPEVTRVLERKCEVRERRVAANLGFLGRVRPQRPARRRRVRKTPTPVCSSSPPPRAGAQPPQLHVGKALPVRPRALALAGLLRRGIVGATPGAHLPTPPSMLPVIPALLPRDRGLPGSAAKKATWRAAAQSSPSPGPWSPSRPSTTAQTASS